MGTSKKGSSWSMWSGSKPRNRFSIEELSFLHETLIKHPVVTESNKDIIVETLRSIAELMIWGDQNNANFFDFFLENQVLAEFLRLVAHRNSRRGGVGVQIFQTLSIMIQNTKRETAMFYLFSNNHLNEIISYKYDFGDEELLAYYISFLKTISMKLNERTVQFFFHMFRENTYSFPLYDEAIKFFRHSESMVRAAVRTLTLNVFSVPDDMVRDYVMHGEQKQFFTNLIALMREQFQQLVELRMCLVRQEPNIKPRLEALLPEIDDLLMYCNDILLIGVPALSSHLSRCMWDLFIAPYLLPALLFRPPPPPASILPSKAAMAGGSRPGLPTSSRAAGPTPGAVASAALFTLSRLMQAMTYPPLLAAISATLVASPAAAGHAVRGMYQQANHVAPFNNPLVREPSHRAQAEGRRDTRSEDSAGAAISNAAASEEALSRLRAGTPSSSAAEAMVLGLLRRTGSNDMSTKEGGWGIRAASSGRPSLDPEEEEEREEEGKSFRASVLGQLWEDEWGVADALVVVLVSMMQNKEVPDWVLEDAGAMPLWRQKKKLLLQALTSSDREDETSHFGPVRTSPPPLEQTRTSPTPAAPQTSPLRGQKAPLPCPH